MPNWCLNNLTIEHEDRTKVLEFVYAYKEGKSCEHYLPMPKGEDWWEWNTTKWGTKWDIGSDNGEIHGLNPTVVENQATMTFDSAWSPPVGLYKELQLKGFRVIASYFEPGMTYCGTWVDGNDSYIEYGDDKDLIPAQVWEDYNLSEFFETTDAEV